MSCISMKRLPYLAENENNQIDDLISLQKTQRSYREVISDFLSKSFGPRINKYVSPDWYFIKNDGNSRRNNLF